MHGPTPAGNADCRGGVGGDGLLKRKTRREIETRREDDKVALIRREHDAPLSAGTMRSPLSFDESKDKDCGTQFLLSGSVNYHVIPL